MLVHGGSVLLFCHLVVLVVALGGVLDDVGVGAGVDLYVLCCLGHPVLGRRDVLPFVVVVEWNTL